MGPNRAGAFPSSSLVVRGFQFLDFFRSTARRTVRRDILKKLRLFLRTDRGDAKGKRQGPGFRRQSRDTSF